jgi:hypothetical protein
VIAVASFILKSLPCTGTDNDASLANPRKQSLPPNNSTQDIELKILEVEGVHKYVLACLRACVPAFLPVTVTARD